MADIAYAIQLALGTLSKLSGQTIQYALTKAGPWTSFASGIAVFLEAKPPQILAYDENHNAIMAPMSATLKVSLGGPTLTPGVYGSFIMDQTGIVWSVKGITPGEAEYVYELGRSSETSQGTVRGSL